MALASASPRLVPFFNSSIAFTLPTSRAMTETLFLRSSGMFGSKNSAPHFWHFKSVEVDEFIVCKASNPTVELTGRGQRTRHSSLANGKQPYSAPVQRFVGLRP